MLSHRCHSLDISLVIFVPITEQHVWRHFDKQNVPKTHYSDMPWCLTISFFCLRRQNCSSFRNNLSPCFVLTWASHIPNQATRDPTGVSKHSYRITIIKVASLPVVPQVLLFVLVPGDLLADLGQSFSLKAQHKWISGKKWEEWQRNKAPFQRVLFCRVI